MKHGGHTGESDTKEDVDSPCQKNIVPSQRRIPETKRVKKEGVPKEDSVPSIESGNVPSNLHTPSIVGVGVFGVHTLLSITICGLVG